MMILIMDPPPRAARSLTTSGTFEPGEPHPSAEQVKRRIKKMLHLLPVLVSGSLAIPNGKALMMLPGTGLVLYAQAKPRPTRQ